MKKCKKSSKSHTINFNLLENIDNSMISLMVEKFIMNQLEPIDLFIINDLHNKVFGPLTISYDSLSVNEQIEKMVNDLIKYLNEIKQM